MEGRGLSEHDKRADASERFGLSAFWPLDIAWPRIAAAGVSTEGLGLLDRTNPDPVDGGPANSGALAQPPFGNRVFSDAERFSEAEGAYGRDRDST